MSEATARLLLAELDATEALLRGLAAENLSYRQILGVERRASRRCAELLARVGFVEPMPARSPVGAQPEPARAEEAFVEDFARDATDELLSGVVAQSIGNAPGPDRMALSDADFEVLDDGPEGVAEEAHDLVSDEHTAEPEAVPEPEALPELELHPDDEEDDDTAESAASEDFDEPVLSASTGFEVELEDATEPEPFEPDAEADTEDPGYLGARSWEETGVPNLDADTILLADPLAPIPPEPPPAKPAESWVSYVSYGDDQEVESDDSPTLSNRASAAAPAADPYAHLVSYVSEEPEVEQAEEAPVLDPEVDDDWGRRRREILMSDVGADALVTMEEHSTVLMSDMLGGSDVPGEMEEESFDLMPDVSEEADIHEDDEVTIVRTEDKPRAPVRTAPPPLSDTPSWATSSPPSPTRTAPPPTPKPIAPAAPRAAAAAGVGTGGLYGGATVPTIRDTDDPRPRAAAIQLNAGGGGGARVLGLEEEEEPIEIGAAEDDPDHVAGSDSGFSLQVQEYEEEVYEEEEEEEEEDEEVVEQARPELPPGPTAAELAALLDRAQTAATNGDLQGGADLYSDLLDQDPDNLEAHVARGRLYLDLGDYSRAMSDFSVAEDIDPANPEPQVAIGDLYFARKDYRKAIDFFNAALELAPNHAMAYCRRGISHYYRKNYPEAVADLEKANKLDGDIPNIKSYVSMAKKKSK